MNKYECDICGKIFFKRILIIKHFRNSLCFPESHDYFENNSSIYNLCNYSKNSMLYINNTNNLVINNSKQIKKCTICQSVIQNNKFKKNLTILHTKEINSKCDSCLELYRIPYTNTHCEKKELGWKCNICGKLFTKLSILKAHKFIHSEKKPVDCDKCIKSCMHFNSIDKHKTILNTLSCNICHIQFPKNSSLVAHQVIHNLKNIDKYNNCLENNNSNSSLFQHTSKLHNYSQNYECSSCSKIFHKRSEIVNHIFKYHQEHYSKYSCDTCSNFYKSSEEFVFHLEKTLFKCDVCSQSFTTAYRLHQHYRWHLGIDSFKCQYCSKIFSKYSVYLFHEKNHTGEKPFRCNFCGKWFPVLSNLNIHLKFNDLFVCNICQKIFSKMSSLILHKRIHSNDVQLESKNKVFSQSSTFKIHSRKHTSKKVYKCNACFKSFTRLSLLNSHLNTHINDVRKCDNSSFFLNSTNKYKKTNINDECLKCKLCQEKFANKNIFITHKCFPHECKLCQKKFNNTSILKKHYNNFHKNMPNPNETLTNINKHKKVHNQPENGISLTLNVNNELNKMEKIFLNRYYKCDLCMLEIYNPSQIINHILQTHY